MELLKENSNQRYYKLPFEIKNHYGPGKEKTISEIWSSDPLKINPEFELAEDVSQSINKICISDAHTHIERLVFPAFSVLNKKTGEITVCHRNNTIDGSLTFMTHGGSSKSIHPDRVYVRHLKMINSGT